MKEAQEENFPPPIVRLENSPFPAFKITLTKYCAITKVQKQIHKNVKKQIEQIEYTKAWKKGGKNKFFL